MTRQLFTFESWDEVIVRGGLRNCLPLEQWNDIWEEKAANETVGRVIMGYSNHKFNDALTAMVLLDKMKPTT